ncbi:MAG: adenosylhomocysteinase [Ruminococcaceae bacterium]|nr:adenosylhomocysteinase [Oscillospiraceae bacterium]
MNQIKDIKLAPSGHAKINWVKDYMPTLSAIEKDFIKTKPFAGMKIAMSIHLEAKTAYLATVLKNGGADVYATGCNPLSTQDDVAAALSEYGVHVYAVHGDNEENYTARLKKTLSCKPDLMIDDGGDFIALLHAEDKDLGVNLIGGCEETTTGIHRLRQRERAGTLLYPMIDVNDADCKHLFDNRYGTGQSTLDAIMHTTNLIIAGKTAVVAGYGWCGKGIAMRLKGMGARVIVTEIDPVKALEAAMDGFSVMKMDDAAFLGDLFITATGCSDVITRKHFEVMKDGVLLSNSGHFDVEINKKDLLELCVSHEERKPCIEGFTMADGRKLNLLAEGRLVNLAAGNGHPAEIMDMSFAIQAKGLEYLAKNPKKEPKLYAVPAEIDKEVANVKLASMGLALDVLTDEQKEYLGV